jgi:hypothetical protein
MTISKTLAITDDSGFLAIVNADNYKSFVDHDWEYGQLIKHFVDQMNNNSLIIWATCLEGERTIHFTDKQSNEKSFRQFSKFINVTSGQLWLINYEDLTVAAQFEDEKIPLNHNKNLFIQLDNGIYNVTIKQFFDPNHDGQLGNTHFEAVLEKADVANESPIDKVFWSTK